MATHRDEFLEDLRNKLTDWENQLAVLEDDAERAAEGDTDEYMEMIQDLFRAYEDIESRVDEVEQMAEDEFDDELPLMETRIEELETALDAARDKIKDV